MNKSLNILVSLFILVAPLTGCIPFTAASTAVVGTTIAEERTAGDKLNDNIIEIKIKETFTQEHFSEMFERISVNAMEGRVLLTGSVSAQEYTEKATQLAWRPRGVKEVINEIEVGEKMPKDRAKDLFIVSTIKSKFLLEKDFRSINYTVDVNNGTVFLLGVAQNNNELNRAMTIASEVKGVKRVVSHVITKNDMRRSS